MQCRICLDEQGNDWVVPCACSGTMQFVHASCLNQWRHSKPGSASYHRCDQCLTPYCIRFHPCLYLVTFLVSIGRAWVVGKSCCEDSTWGAIWVGQLTMSSIGMMTYVRLHPEHAQAWAQTTPTVWSRAFRSLLAPLFGLCMGFAQSIYDIREEVRSRWLPDRFQSKNDA